jgi:hypothetical protein
MCAVLNGRPSSASTIVPLTETPALPAVCGIKSLGLNKVIMTKSNDGSVIDFIKLLSRLGSDIGVSLPSMGRVAHISLATNLKGGAPGLPVLETWVGCAYHR